MSLAPSKPRPSPEPAFDLDYSIHDIELSPHRDNRFLIERMEEALLRESASGTSILDVACGVGAIAARLARRGQRTCGLDPSGEMLGLGVLIDPPRRAILVRGLAESLPFGDGSIDVIVCEGALDHFVSPHEFMRESARALRPGGRLVIALANFESLSCRLGSSISRLARKKEQARPYWQPPADHHHKGNLGFVRSLEIATLRLDRCYGISLLWLLPGWGKLLDCLPAATSSVVLRALDRIAYRRPALSDVIVSVWNRAGR